MRPLQGVASSCAMWNGGGRCRGDGSGEAWGVCGLSDSDLLLAAIAVYKLVANVPPSAYICVHITRSNTLARYVLYRC